MHFPILNRTIQIKRLWMFRGFFKFLKSHPWIHNLSVLMLTFNRQMPLMRLVIIFPWLVNGKAVESLGKSFIVFWKRNGIFWELWLKLFCWFFLCSWSIKGFLSEKNTDCNEFIIFTEILFCIYVYMYSLFNFVSIYKGIY